MSTETSKPNDSKSPKSTNNSAALRGASLAFEKPPVKPKPGIDYTYSGNSGALAAATKANGYSRPTSRSTSRNRWEAEERRLEYHTTGESNVSGYAGDLNRIQQRFSRLDGGGNNHLQVPSPGPVRQLSSSYIAATLAASRSASVTPTHTGQRQLSASTMKRQSSFTRHSPGRSSSSVRSLTSREGEDHVLDTSSIPPTTSLIGMFERNAAFQNGNKPALKRSTTITTVSPRPSSNTTSTIRSRAPDPLITKFSKPPELKSPKPSFTRPILIDSREIKSKAPQPARKPSIPTSKAIPVPSKVQPPQPQNEDDYASSDDSFVSASDYQPSWRAALQNQNRRLTTNSTVSMNTVDSLANAIVASSLASSRAASPSKFLHSNLQPSPPPPRRSPHKHLFHNTKETSRTPSPAKQSTVLRTTLRKPKTDEDIDEGEMRRKKKAHLMKKHPNKHHEGDRKRWRDEITERERKRYEAVWASNKGLYAAPGSESIVCNLVVRDIFSRSRLHTDVLEEVYSLIDRRQIGELERDEFVVGLWLIDQRLKGRKLPIRVSDSVWRSVGILSGIKVKKAK